MTPPSPAATSDARTGKRTPVVSPGRHRARLVYLVIALLAALCIPLGVAFGVLPAPTFLALPARVPALAAARQLWHHAEIPAALAPAIKLTLASAHFFGLLPTLALVFREPEVSP